MFIWSNWTTERNRTLRRITTERFTTTWATGPDFESNILYKWLLYTVAGLQRFLDSVNSHQPFPACFNVVLAYSQTLRLNMRFKNSTIYEILNKTEHNFCVLAKYRHTLHLLCVLFRCVGRMQDANTMRAFTIREATPNEVYALPRMGSLSEQEVNLMKFSTA